MPGINQYGYEMVFFVSMHCYSEYLNFQRVSDDVNSNIIVVNLNF